MTSPTVAAGQGVAEAHLEIFDPPGDAQQKLRVPLRFNPTEYQLSKANTFAEITIPGLESPPLQYVRGTPRRSAWRRSSTPPTPSRTSGPPTSTSCAT